MPAGRSPMLNEPPPRRQMRISPKSAAIARSRASCGRSRPTRRVRVPAAPCLVRTCWSGRMHGRWCGRGDRGAILQNGVTGRQVTTHAPRARCCTTAHLSASLPRARPAPLPQRSRRPLASTNTNTNTKHICDTGQTSNKLIAQWVHLTNHAAGHSRPGTAHLTASRE